jgi:ABC-type lipoprotein export system ATPase subunit
MSNIVVCKGVHKSYYLKNETVNVLRGIDLEAKQGSFVVIFGPSGSGKSTLLNIIGSLDQPTEGKVWVDSIDLFKYPDRELSRIRNRKIGFVFQFHHLLPEFTALENIALPAIMNGTRPKDAQARAHGILDKLNMADKHHRLPDELSGGERQRVAIGRALINEPLLVLADEPTGNLDDENTNKLIDMFIALKSEGRTIILVTHSFDFARLGSDLYNLKEGRLYAMR